MVNTPYPGSCPPRPAEDALHPQAVQVRADQPADPHAMLGVFEQLLGGYAAGADAGADAGNAAAEPIALVVALRIHWNSQTHRTDRARLLPPERRLPTASSAQTPMPPRMAPASSCSCRRAGTRPLRARAGTDRSYPLRH